MSCTAVLTGLSQEVRATAGTDSTRYRIGDWVNVTVRLTLPETIASISPVVPDSLGSFEILRILAPAPDEQSEPQQTWVFRLTSFQPSETSVIPPIEFQYTLAGAPASPNSAFTNPLQVTIDDVKIDPAGDIRDIRPPLQAPFLLEDTIPYLIALAALGLAIAAYVFLKRRRRLVAEVKESRPALPPHVIALSALRELEDQRLWQQGKIKEYYSAITEIIRRFLEGRFAIVAMEMTSEEILQQLRRVEEAASLWKEINSFFLTADLVKFAAYRPTTAEHEAELRWAYEIVRSMTPKPVPEAQKVEEERVR